MKKNLTKLMALGLVVVMGATAAVGCGSKDGDGGSKTKDGKTKLTFGMWSETQMANMQAMIDEYEKQNPNVEIELQSSSYKEYWTKFEAAAAGGTAPDVMWMNVLHLDSYKDAGVLAELDDAIEEGGLELEGNFPAALIDAYTRDGKMYGIPKDFDTNALFYNKEIFDNAGVAYPTDDWTYDDLLACCQELIDKGLGEGVYPFACPVDFQTWYYQTVYANGGYILNEDATETGYDLPETQEGIQCWIDMIEKGYAPSLNDINDTSADARFQSGHLAMNLAGSYMVAEYLQNDAIVGKIDCVEVPAFNGKEPNCINGLSYSVYANSKNLEEAKKFAVWMGSSEAMEIQGQNATVFPARNDAQHCFADSFPELNIAAYTNHVDEAVALPVCEKAAELYDLEAEQLKHAYDGSKSLEEVCKTLKEEADALISK